MKRAELRELLDQAGIHPSRGKGQNFLIEETLADAIARDGEIGPEDVVLEIGTGLGVLTTRLLPLAGRVVGVEKDERVLALARPRLEAPNLTLVEADALANKNALNPEVLSALERALEGGRRLRVVANLPYSVATPLVVGLLAAAQLPLESMVVMVQWEAAERFAALPGDEAYGAVSVLCHALSREIRILRKVPPEVFWPRPKVQSAVVRFLPRQPRLPGFEVLAEVVRALFNFRRKTLQRAAREVAAREPALGWLPAAVEASGLEPRRRPEELGLEEFRLLARRAP